MSRPGLDEYFMGFARQAAARATCDRGRSGAVIVVDGQVVSTGYVGAAKGLPHCDDVGHLIREVTYLDEGKGFSIGDSCPRCDSGVLEKKPGTEESLKCINGCGCTFLHDRGPVREHCMRTAHAEGNAIVQAAKHGIAINGGTMYCKMEPCLRCCVDIINGGIKRVVAEYRYHGAAVTREWFKLVGVELVVLNDENAKYEEKK